MNQFFIVVEQNVEMLAVFWLVCTIVATHLGAKKGVPFLGFLNGLLMGPIGLLLVVLVKDQLRFSCPNCAESIMKKAKICPYCKTELSS
ncbi:hypothetical protein [Vibrio breoganii]|uniref:hypothetical protein n=1 Tax=Vibrio breoganii TaxID=553239 RepID=UPI000C814B3D|nr:hypothetical protein [Vibrio breoganii]PMM16928.1 hypothetical protein BCT59_15620 [Vibrio breoganii]PMO56506.1 hypothetical protein BCT07_14550 [Vibrio breoganii]